MYPPHIKKWWVHQKKFARSAHNFFVNVPPTLKLMAPPLPLSWGSLKQGLFECGFIKAGAPLNSLRVHLNRGILNASSLKQGPP